MIEANREGSITALVLLDGIQMTALIVTLPFVIFGSDHDLANSLFSATPIGAGFALGILGTFLVGRWTDRRSALRALQFLQILQAVFVVCIVSSALSERFFLLGLFGMLALAISRSVGPAKDKIRSEFIGANRRTAFNAQVRRYFLVANEIIGALCTVTISIMPSRYWSLLLIVSLVSICASVIVAGSLRSTSVMQGSNSSKKAQNLPKGSRFQLLIGLIVVGLLGITSAFPTIGISAWILSSHTYAPWFITVIGLFNLSVDFFFIKLLSDYLDNRPARWRDIHRFGGALSICAVVGTVAAVTLDTPFIQAPLMMFAMLCATLAYSVSMMLALEIQFGYGSQGTRGRIASYTRLSSVAAMALASLIAPAIFLGSLATAVILVVVGIAICLLPHRLTLSWASLAK